MLVYPAVQGKGYEVSNFVAGLMHVVGYYSIRVVEKKGEAPKQVRRILWQHYKDPKTETTYFAKDQFDKLGFSTDDPKMHLILEQIDGVPFVSRTGAKAAPAAKKTAVAPARRRTPVAAR
jgi:hypothetical protein